MANPFTIGSDVFSLDYDNIGNFLKSKELEPSEETLSMRVAFSVYGYDWE
jgi:hypothetical protein